MDSHLKDGIVGISSLSMSPTLDGKADVKHFISEKIHKPNVLSFWINIWYSTHLKWVLKGQCDFPQTSL